MSKKPTPPVFPSSGLPLTKVTAEFSYHAVWIGSGDLREPGQNEDVAVLKRSLVHGLKGNSSKISPSVGRFHDVCVERGEGA